MSMVMTIFSVSPETIEMFKSNPDAVSARMEDDDRSCYLDKSWHGLHFLLCGSAGEGEIPAASLLMGGSPVGEDWGYGPPRVLSPDETQAFASHIDGISAAEFDNRFDAQALLDNDIYPDIWDRDLNGEPDGRPELNERFAELKEFFQSVVSAKHGVLIAMS
jgi:hypothetical protein